ncbi:MAG: hypothetical protein H0W83_00895 [Planctomycetes bacterium]|nr:hypothetical protein [Planctomycetota bacterium]
MIPRLLVVLAVVFLTGCWQSREETTRQDRITFQAQVPLVTAEGVKLVPVSGTIRRVGSEEATTRSAPDVEEIAALVGRAVAGVSQAANPFPWSNIVGGVGAALTAATTGYLALKKREQMKPPAKGG